MAVAAYRTVVSHVDCFRISKPWFMAQRFGKIGNEKSEMGRQAMKMPIPPSHEKLRLIEGETR